MRRSVVLMGTIGALMLAGCSTQATATHHVPSTLPPTTTTTVVAPTTTSDPQAGAPHASASAPAPGASQPSYGPQTGQYVEAQATDVSPDGNGGVSFTFTVQNRGTMTFPSKLTTQLEVIDSAGGTHIPMSHLGTSEQQPIDSDVLFPTATVTGSIDVPLPSGTTPVTIVFDPWANGGQGDLRWTITQ